MEHAAKYWRVPFKVIGDCEEPFRLMHQAWETLLEEIGDEHWLYAGQHSGDAARFMDTVNFRIARVEATVAPDYLFALVEIGGTWVDGQGDRHDFYTPLKAEHHNTLGYHGPDGAYEQCRCGARVTLPTRGEYDDFHAEWAEGQRRWDFHRWQALASVTQREGMGR